MICTRNALALLSVSYSTHIPPCEKPQKDAPVEKSGSGRESNAHPHPTFIMVLDSGRPYGFFRCSLCYAWGWVRSATGQKYAQQRAAGHQCAWSTSEKFYLLIYDAETFLWGCCCCYHLRKAEEDEGKVKNGQKFSRERDDDIAVRGDTINLSTQRMI